MRILYVTQKFYPESLAVERFWHQVQQLIRLGHRVTVLTTMPSYPHGRVFPKYRGRWFVRERISDCDIVRVPSVTAPNHGMFLRALSYLSFTLSAAVTGLFLRPADLVIAAVPNPGAELVGLVVARAKGCKCLLEMVDLVPENLSFVGIGEHTLLYRCLDAYYRTIYRLVDWLAVLCPSAGSVLKDKGIDARRILLLPNGADEDLLDDSSAQGVRVELECTDKFLVVYSGSFSPYYEVPNLVRAAHELSRRGASVKVVLLGEGPDSEKVAELIRTTGCCNVVQAGCVPREDFVAYLHAADLLVFSMVADPAPAPYRDILTAKLCEYLYVGRPIVAVESGDIAGAFIEKIGAGTRVAARQPEALATAILRYAANPELAHSAGLAAQAYARAHLDRAEIVKGFMDEVEGRMEIPC